VIDWSAGLSSSTSSSSSSSCYLLQFFIHSTDNCVCGTLKPTILSSSH